MDLVVAGAADPGDVVVQLFPTEAAFYASIIVAGTGDQVVAGEYDLFTAT